MGMRFNAMALALFALLPGCVEQDETIRVEANGRVHISVTMVADAAEELRAGRVPHVNDGWRITMGERDEKTTLTALRTLDPDEPFPASFADPVGGTADAELTFPTEVIVERRGGTTYYHFRRVYPARSWANVAAVEAMVREQFGLGEDADLDFEKLDADGRAHLIRALATLEVRKTLVLARSAFLDAAPDAPQDAWLEARQAALGQLDAMDFGYLASLVAAAEDPLAQLQLQKEGERFEAAVHDAMLRSLAEFDLDDRLVNAFSARLDWYAHARKASEELSAQKFKVAVTLPGTVVASNADSTDGGTVRWSFDGSQMQDRTIELMATSRVP